MEMPLLWGLGGNIQAPVLFLTLCVSLPYIHTSLWLTWSEQGWEEALCSFSPLSAALNSPLCLLPFSPILTPHHSPQILPSEQNSWTGEGFPAGPDLSCKKMTHLLKKLGKREKRQFREGKHKQRCFNMMVASGTQRKVEEGKRKIAYNTNPLNGSLET